MTSLSRFLLATVCILIAGANVADAQDYPTKPIYIFTAPAGGGNDIPARLIGQELSARMGQPVIIENRPPLLATEAAKNAPADGYNLLFQSDSMWTLPLLQHVSYDPVKDFTPISLTGIIPNVLVVNPSVPAKSIKELIALAKAKPGQLNYGTGGFGSSTHLAAELFKSMAGVNLVAIQYKGGPPANTALLSGEIQVMFPVVNTVLGEINSGQLRALGVSTLEPSLIAPGIPTIASSGLPGYESEQTQGFFAQANVPPAIVARLNKEILQILAMPELRKKLLSLGIETVGSSPEQFADAIKKGIDVTGKLIKSGAVRPTDHTVQTVQTGIGKGTERQLGFRRKEQAQCR